MWWIINIVGMLLAWHFTDLNSSSSLENIVFPTMVGVFLIGLLIQLVLALGHSNGRDTTADGGGFFGGYGDGDGDCGGGGDC